MALQVNKRTAGTSGFEFIQMNKSPTNSRLFVTVPRWTIRPNCCDN